MIRRYLLDTGIAQDFQDDRNRVRDRANVQRKPGHRIGICVPVLGGLWSGVEGSASRDLNLQRLRHALSRFVVWPYTNAAAAEFGRIFAELRSIGRVIQQIDIQIAAIGLTLPNCVLVTKDSDFGAINGLTVEDWSS